MESHPSPHPNVYIRLIGYLRPYLPQVLIGYVSMLGASLLNLFVPQIIKGAIDRGLTTGNGRTLFYAALLILGVAVIRGVAGFG